MVRERVMSIVLRERERRARRSQTVVFGAFASLSFFQKSDDDAELFRSPRDARARERGNVSERGRERERERERESRKKRDRSSSSFAVVAARVQNSDAFDGKRTTPKLSKERKDPHTRESAIRERETFSFATHTRTGYLQHRLKRRRVGLLFHQTRERVRGQTRCCCCSRSVHRHLVG